MPSAATPSRGSPTPVTSSPADAVSTRLPASCPIDAGKIRLPAPKNSPNSILPTASSSRKESFVFISNTFCLACPIFFMIAHHKMKVNNKPPKRCTKTGGIFCVRQGGRPKTGKINPERYTILDGDFWMINGKFCIVYVTKMCYNSRQRISVWLRPGRYTFPEAGQKFNIL